MHTVSKRYALLTLHGKEVIFADGLRPLAAEIVLTQDYNTDLLGSFDGLVKRQLPPDQCAELKARKAIELTGIPLGLGSEGSFGPGPMGMPCNQEWVACVDAEQDWVVWGQATNWFALRQFDQSQQDELRQWLQQQPEEQGFEWHWQDSQEVLKGLKAQQVRQLLPSERPFKLGLDLRAHQCPPRRQVIRRAVEDLLQSLQQLCPNCQKPGFRFNQPIKGLPCGLCYFPTEQAKAMQAHCRYCGFQRQQARNKSHAEPQYCPRCNP